MVIFWNDTQLDGQACLPRRLYYLTSITCLVMACLVTNNVITDFYIKDKIIGLVEAIFLFYFGLCNILMILTGREYVKSVKKENENFLITNVYDEKISFGVAEIKLVSSARFSLTHFFLSGFSRRVSGLHLCLNNGCRYRISATMENIDSLRDCLLNMSSS